MPNEVLSVQLREVQVATFEGRQKAAYEKEIQAQTTGQPHTGMPMLTEELRRGNDIDISPVFLCVDSEPTSKILAYQVVAGDRTITARLAGFRQIIEGFFPENTGITLTDRCNQQTTKIIRQKLSEGVHVVLQTPYKPA